LCGHSSAYIDSLHGVLRRKTIKYLAAKEILLASNGSSAYTAFFKR